MSLLSKTLSRFPKNQSIILLLIGSCLQEKMVNLGTIIDSLDRRDCDSNTNVGISNHDSNTNVGITNYDSNTNVGISNYDSNTNVDI